jgi:hypothetical protein
LHRCWSWNQANPPPTKIEPAQQWRTVLLRPPVN